MTYFDVVIADSPFHYWEFPPGGGQLTEDFGSSPNPQIGSAAVNGYAGIWDGGLSSLFNGTASYTTDDLEGLTAPVTEECWVWIYSFSGAQSNVLTWPAGGTNGCNLFVNASRQAAFAVDNLSIHDTGTLTKHAWHHLVGVYSGGTATLFVDGANVASTGGGGGLNAGTSAFLIGQGLSGAGKWNGLLASAAVYHSALNSTQITAHFNAANTRLIFPQFVSAPPGGFLSLVTSPFGGSGLLSQIWNAVHKVY